MPINKKELTKEQIEKAMQCKNADELIALAKVEGYEITKDEAEAYMEELGDVELDSEKLKNVAGGGCYAECQSVCGCDWECPHDVRGSR
jgi:predicted ribosomally synthesized peptide with nif11-like leader